VSRPKFYITCAIDYVNARPHLGTAYEKIAADCIARAHRSLGFDVLFAMGNDEHSTNVEKSAKAEGLTPLAWCDRMEGEFRKAWERLEISFDDFIRTSQPRHHAAVREVLRRVQANGHIRRDKYTGWYCEGCEAFYTEKDLVDGKCPNHATKPRWVEEENYFFRLSAFRDWLIEHIGENPDFIRPATRRNEILAFLEQGLEDLSISRAGVEWGIPFPDDPDHVVYVWFDALTNYLSTVGFGSDEELTAKWWPADVHVIGKDITRFHCIIWPAMLKAAGVDPPASVFGHGFVYHSGEKMSKSLGNVVSPLDVVDVTGPDALRYFLLREITFGKDGDFTWDAFIGRTNADLANDLGNLVKRTVDMTAKFRGGRIEAGADAGSDRTGLASLAAEVADRTREAYRRFDLSGALGATWELVRRANQAIQETKPWELAKDPARGDELSGVLSELLEAIRFVSFLAEPAVPGKAAEIRERLGTPSPAGRPWDRELVWRDRAAWSVTPGDPLFPRIERAPAAETPAPKPAGSGKSGSPKKKGKGPKAEATPPGTIDIDDFRKVRLRVATILAAERVEGADRLLRLEVDLGEEKRQIVAGIADRFAPEDLPGRQVVVVANLKPAKIRGLESQGMLLAAQADGALSLIGPDGEIAPGAPVS
jgi:methionyl-tRNA synthetase